MDDFTATAVESSRQGQLTPAAKALLEQIHASGFQSWQYRALEFILGNKDEKALLPFRSNEKLHASLTQRLAAPSLYDEFLRYLARQHFPLPQDRRADGASQLRPLSGTEQSRGIEAPRTTAHVAPPRYA